MINILYYFMSNRHWMPIVYKGLDIKAIDIIRWVTQGEKEIYCVQLC